MTATITGADRLLAKLRRMPQTAREEIRAAMAAQAEEICDMMRRLVPVEYGDLQRSIGWSWGGRAPKGSLKVASVNSDVGAGDLTITIYAGSAKAYYARWVEFGTQPHSLARGADISRSKRQWGAAWHPGAKAHPFFYVTWRASRKPAKRRMQTAVRNAARRVAQGG